MAGVAGKKGVTAEIATFEDWQPTSRTFDLVLLSNRIGADGVDAINDALAVVCTLS